MSLSVGTTVSTSYRWPMWSAHPDCWGLPWKGVLLSRNDIRAWSHTVAFRGIPTQEAVDAHLADLDERGWSDDKVPVLYEWGVAWEITSKVRPYIEVLRDWASARRAAYQERSLVQV